MTYTLLMKFKFSDILYGGLLWPSCMIRQLTGSVFNTDKKGSKNCFNRFCWTLPYLTSIILFHVFVHQPKIPVVFNTNVKNAKNEDFLISSIIYTGVNFKVLWCFLICYSVLWWHAMKSDSHLVFYNVRDCFLRFFALINKKYYKLCNDE